MRDNRAEFNVAGIEIENSTHADVYRNIATNNTGGILVFNLPGLPVKDGRKTRVYSNHIHDNNTDNFAPKGNIVATVPTGTGFMVLANDEVEFFDNQRREQPHRERADPVVRHAPASRRTTPRSIRIRSSISIHDNHFAGGGDSPDQLELKAMKVAKFGLTGSLPDILWDGAMAKGMRRRRHADLHSRQRRRGLRQYRLRRQAREVQHRSAAARLRAACAAAGELAGSGLAAVELTRRIEVAFASSTFDCTAGVRGRCLPQGAAHRAGFRGRSFPSV